MFSMCSELTPRARIPDTRIPQLMQPCLQMLGAKNLERKLNDGTHLLFAAERLLFLPRQIEFGNTRFKTTRKQT